MADPAINEILDLNKQLLDSIAKGDWLIAHGVGRVFEIVRVSYRAESGNWGAVQQVVNGFVFSREYAATNRFSGNATLPA